MADGGDGGTLTDELTGRAEALEARCRQLEMEKAILAEALVELQQAIMVTANHSIRIGQFLGQVGTASQEPSRGLRDGNAP